MKRPRIFRLLPSVVALGTVLLALKATDLVHEAYAQVSGQMAALTQDPVPANKDYAGGDGDQNASASEVDVLNSLAKRRKELDAREARLNTQANIIAAAESRVDAKIAQLKQLQSQINSLFVQRDDAQAKQIANLVKTYSSMKPKDAARIFDALPDDVLLPVAQQIKPDILASLMSNMNADHAMTLTVKLAKKLSLPQTMDALATAGAPPAPTPPQSATPSNAPVAEANSAPARSKVRRPRPSAQSSASAASSAPSSSSADPTASAQPAAAAPPQN
jgi:flagellar motility protein MotE (MotC chaperone)